MICDRIHRDTDLLTGQTITEREGWLLTEAACRLVSAVARSTSQDRARVQANMVVREWLKLMPDPDPVPCEIPIAHQGRLIESVAATAVDNLIDRLITHRASIIALAVERATGPEGAAYGDQSWRKPVAELDTETDAELADGVVYQAIRLWSPVMRVLLGLEQAGGELITIDTEERRIIHGDSYTDTEGAEAQHTTDVESDAR